MLVRYTSMSPKNSSATPQAPAPSTPPVVLAAPAVPAAPAAPTAPAAPQLPRRIPKPHGGIHYNACKNPVCPQYGIPAPASAARGVKGPYALVGGGKSYPLLRCNACGETPPLKSNAGIVEEIERLSAYLKPEAPLFCPRETCDNHKNKVPLETSKAYRSFGTNAHGSKRVQCCLCKKTFIASGKPAKGQHDSHLNREIFNMLVNKVALSRIVKMLDVSWAVLRADNQAYPTSGTSASPQATPS